MKAEKERNFIETKEEKEIALFRHPAWS